MPSWFKPRDSARTVKPNWAAEIGVQRPEILEISRSGLPDSAAPRKMSQSVRAPSFISPPRSAAIVSRPPGTVKERYPRFDGVRAPDHDRAGDGRLRGHRGPGVSRLLRTGGGLRGGPGARDATRGVRHTDGASRALLPVDGHLLFHRDRQDGQGGGRG